ncbi:MAG: hypothetical protein DWQ06_16280 [Calditrichaeota bacterium]|nr:MAG: hypothetical protein DWQ06_16280 [Calditrichota bacterium]
MISSVSNFKILPKITRFVAILGLLGLVTFICGLFFAPQRIWANFLINFFYFTGLGVGAGFLIAIQYVANAGWGIAIRRIPEAITSTLPFAAVGGLVLIFGIHTLYEWSHEAVVAQDTILLEKSVWMNEPLFIARIIGYFVVWILLCKFLVKNSVKQDEDGDVKYTKRNVRNSVFFLILGIYTFCLASIDWIMSLQPHWYSTIFGWLNLASVFESAIAATVIVVVILRHIGYKQIFKTVHLHELGKLMMAFCFFWVYMWVSQHMLIWYSNIPEETSYYIFRHFGGWGSVSFVNLALNWLVPFLMLLPRKTKENDKVMFQAAIILLIGHWVDLYIMIMPSQFGAEPMLGIWEIGPFIGMISGFFWLVFKSLTKHNLIPTRDPYLVESLPEFEATKS